MSTKEQKKANKYIGIFFLTLVVCLGVMGSINYVVDPFMHYHAPWGKMPLVYEDQVYQTPGAARNLTYDSALLGTSMSENFHASWFEEGLGWDTVKLSYEGARSSDYRVILNQVEKSGQQVHHIVLDLNLYQLVNPADSVRVERPEFLYDENPINDVTYLFNKDAFAMSMNRIMMRCLGETGNEEDAYTWNDETLFCAFNAYRDAWGPKQNLLERKKQGENLRDFSPEAKEDNCTENLNQLLEYVEHHEETEFHVFFPPYSVLFWEQRIICEEFEDDILLYYTAVERMLKHENIRLYFFQDEKDIITNLDCYRDSNHYSPDVNYFIYDCIKEDSHRMTQENYKEILSGFSELIQKYDYDELWEKYLDEGI